MFPQMLWACLGVLAAAPPGSSTARGPYAPRPHALFTPRLHYDSDKPNIHAFLKAGHERDHTASRVVICSPQQRPLPAVALHSSWLLTPSSHYA